MIRLESPVRESRMPWFDEAGSGNVIHGSRTAALSENDGQATGSYGLARQAPTLLRSRRWGVPWRPDKDCVPERKRRIEHRTLKDRPTS